MTWGTTAGAGIALFGIELEKKKEKREKEKRNEKKRKEKKRKEKKRKRKREKKLILCVQKEHVSAPSQMPADASRPHVTSTSSVG